MSRGLRTAGLLQPHAPVGSGGRTPGQILIDPPTQLFEFRRLQTRLSRRTYYADSQGNTRVLLGKSGGTTSAAAYNYPAWGKVVSWIGAGAASTPLQYTGTYTDQWSQFVFDQARFYDPATGQFLGQDPLVARTLQPFGYAADDPTSESDPTGLAKWKTRNPKQAYKRYVAEGTIRTKKGEPIPYKQFVKGLENIKFKNGIPAGEHGQTMHEDGSVSRANPDTSEDEIIGWLEDVGCVIAGAVGIAAAADGAAWILGGMVLWELRAMMA